METIYKYRIIEGGEIILPLPPCAEILSAQAQEPASLMIWVKLDPDKNTTERRFVVYGTGWDIKETNLKFIDTVQLFDGFSDEPHHVFEDMSHRGK